MKFILLVEGKTEELGVARFINRWLTSQFVAGSAIGVQAVKHGGWSQLHQDTPRRAAKYLTDPDCQDVIAVISLMDLYGPTFYPKDKTTVHERYEWGRAYMKRRVLAHFREKGLSEALASKYHHFFAVHVTEAWLLTRPDLFPRGVTEALRKDRRSPESVNFDAPPGKLLEKLHLEHTKRANRKATVARDIFPRMDPDAAADMCPYLKQMLLELRDAAQHAGAVMINDQV